MILSTVCQERSTLGNCQGACEMEVIKKEFRDNAWGHVVEFLYAAKYPSKQASQAQSKAEQSKAKAKANAKQASKEARSYDSVCWQGAFLGQHLARTSIFAVNVSVLFNLCPGQSLWPSPLNLY